MAQHCGHVFLGSCEPYVLAAPGYLLRLRGDGQVDPGGFACAYQIRISAQLRGAASTCETIRFWLRGYLLGARHVTPESKQCRPWFFWAHTLMIRVIGSRSKTIAPSLRMNCVLGRASDLTDCRLAIGSSTSSIPKADHPRVFCLCMLSKSSHDGPTAHQIGLFPSRKHDNQPLSASSSTSAMQDARSDEAFCSRHITDPGSSTRLVNRLVILVSTRTCYEVLHVLVLTFFTAAHIWH
jgi:hypothetical protein